MSPKAAPKAKKKGAAAPAPAKAAKKAPAKAAGPAKKGAKAAEPAPVDPDAPAVDLEELEEQQEEAAAASKSSSDAALAAASGSTEMSASFKNFRHHPDMENFYRFIYENDLRHEALAIIDKMMLEKRERKASKSGKSAH